MADLSQRIKAELVDLLEKSTAVTTLVPATSIHPLQVPAGQLLPFVRTWFPDGLRPYEDSCGSGSEGAVQFHVFAVGETVVHQISAAIVATLDGVAGFHTCDWVRTQIVPDGMEEDVWHGIVEFSVVRTM